MILKVMIWNCERAAVLDLLYTKKQPLLKWDRGRICKGSKVVQYCQK